MPVIPKESQGEKQILKTLNPKQNTCFLKPNPLVYGCAICRPPRERTEVRGTKLVKLL